MLITLFLEGEVGDGAWGEAVPGQEFGGVESVREGHGEADNTIITGRCSAAYNSPTARSTITGFAGSLVMRVIRALSIFPGRR